MKKVFINEMKTGDSFDEFFLVIEMQLKTTRTEKLYLDMELADRTGVIRAKVWDATEQMARTYKTGTYLRAAGKVQEYRGAKQLVLDRCIPVGESDVDVSDFRKSTTKDVDGLMKEIADHVAGIKDPHLKKLLEKVFGDDALVEKFKAAPAARNYHHAFRGGLLEHTTNVARLAALLLTERPELRADLLMAGCLLHDIGKIDEMNAEAAINYTDAGLLLGHLVQGVFIIEEKLRGVKNFPEDLKTNLRHIILSHHGEYEWGSPKLPMIPEALAIHYLDNLDAKLNAVIGAIKDDPDEESNWTDYNKMFERRFFKK